MSRSPRAPSPAPPVPGGPDDALRARVRSRVPLCYAGGADEALDRPAHVRAGSGVTWWRDRLAVVQDDANFVALVDPDTGLAECVVLPAGPGGVRQFDDGRGNKAHKLDLEAAVVVRAGDEPMLLLLGSGSTGRRERVVTVEGEPHAPRVRVHSLPRLYAALREAREFAGSELNIEGAVCAGDALRLFTRGNGAEKDGTPGTNASCDLSIAELLAHLADPDEAGAPSPRAIVRYELGALGDVPLGFTDALAPDGDGGPVLFTAAAEASPDAVRDGEVEGSVVGVLEPAGAGGAPARARWTPLLDRDGTPVAAKVEGIAPHPTDPRVVYVVVDADDPDLPSELCAVELSGGWPAIFDVRR